MITVYKKNDERQTEWGVSDYIGIDINGIL